MGDILKVSDVAVLEQTATAAALRRCGSHSPGQKDFMASDRRRTKQRWGICEDDANLDVWFLLAIAHHGGGQWDDAEACLDRAAALIAAAGIPADGAESVSLETLRGDVRAARPEAEAEEDGGDGMGVDG